jgi:Fic family protein
LTTLPFLSKIGSMTNKFLFKKFPPDLDNIWSKDFAIQLAAAEGAMSGLNEAVSLLLNPTLLMRPLLDKEAESSSRLEGTQASMEDVYKSAIQIDTEKIDDVNEIINYQHAMLRGEEIIKSRPLNQTVIRQIHKTLMSGVRGSNKNPGEYRSEDVWIGKIGTGVGDARYVPPSPVHLPELMGTLEKFITNPDTHPLIACGLIHHRFEAIHPFKDGNGRTGRLLITLFLLRCGKLSRPMLYPSGYFEKSRDDYLEALHAVDTKEDWYSWLMYFLKALENQAQLSLNVAREIDGLFKDHRERIQDTSAHLGLVRLLEFCFTQPYVSVGLASRKLDIPSNTVRRYIATLEEKEILTFVDSIQRGEKVYANFGLLRILRKI